MSLHKHHPRNNKDASPWASLPVCHPWEPRKGDCYFVQAGSRHFGETFTIRRVNQRSFYVYCSWMTQSPGKTVRRLLVEWEQWIDELFEMGFVFLNGSPVLPPDRLAPLPELDLAGAERQRRFNEAMSEARKLLGQRCVANPAHSRKERRFKVHSSPGVVATVTVPDDERKRITCSCAERLSRGNPCSHIFAVLLGHKEMRHRILEFLL